MADFRAHHMSRTLQDPRAAEADVVFPLSFLLFAGSAARVIAIGIPCEFTPGVNLPLTLNFKRLTID